MWVFWAAILKKQCHIGNEHTRIFPIANFVRNQKCLNLEPKVPCLGIFLAKILKSYCHI